MRLLGVLLDNDYKLNGSRLESSYKHFLNTILSTFDFILESTRMNTLENSSLLDFVQDR